MSNLTVASTVLASLVVLAATALALVMWNARARFGDRRMKFLAAGFAILAVKAAVSIYTIQTHAWHHEVSEFVGTGLEVIAVGFLVAPFFVRSE